jgi:hypothetical protein
MRTTRPGSRIDGLYTHDPHQPLNPLAIYFVAQSAQMISHGATSPAWSLEILLVNEAHQLEILRFNRLLLVVEGGSADVQQPALTGNAQHVMGGIDHLLSLPSV